MAKAVVHKLGQWYGAGTVPTGIQRDAFSALRTPYRVPICVPATNTIDAQNSSGHWYGHFGAAIRDAALWALRNRHRQREGVLEERHTTGTNT